MSIDVTVVLMDLEGTSYRNAPQLVTLEDGRMVENPDSKPLTLRKALLAALNTSKDPLPLDKQRTRQRLAKRIATQDTVEFTATQIVSLGKACAVRYAPLLTGAIMDLLEPGQADTAPTDEEF